MYHIFFIHSFADGCLGCCHVLAMANSAAMSMGVHGSLNFGFVWMYAQEWDCWINHMLILVLVF